MSFLKNWKTTLAGIALVISGASTLINNPTKVQEGLTGIAGGVGLIVAKDAKKEQ